MEVKHTSLEPTEIEPTVLEPTLDLQDGQGWFKKKIYQIFFKYLVSGACSTVVQFGTLATMVELFKFNPTIASGTGFVFACLVNYLMLYYWTFVSNGKHSIVALKYSCVTLLTLGINLSIFWFLTEKLHLWYLFSQVFATSSVFLINFSINYRYTFPSASKVD